MTGRAGHGPPVVGALALLVMVAGLAHARPGGGESYSGGGGFGGGGGGGGDGDGGGAILELAFHLVRLCIYYPQIGLPLLAIIIGYFGFSAWKQRKNKDWDSGPPVELKQAISLAPLRRPDPDFSQPMFEDFAFRLFATAHRARHREETRATLAPYVALPAREHLAARIPTLEPVQSVVVGAQRTIALHLSSGEPDLHRITVEYEANVTVAKATYFSVERWTFVRAPDARSKPPDPSRRFPCPNCGAPWEAANTGTQQCASCREIVDNGRFDWSVSAIELRSMDRRQPTLVGEVPERGTDLPTLRAPGVDRDWAGLETADPAVTGDAFHERLDLVYAQLNESWTSSDLAQVRGLVSDGLYDYLEYWVRAYRQQQLRNVLVDMRITRTELAKVTRDRWFDAVTVRIFATGRDYVIQLASEDVVRGSKRRERPYSEYWTFIRSAARRGAPVTSRACSNCGAELKVSQAGACEYCNAHVTLGEFDWVLSKIEQDDSYRG